MKKMFALLLCLMLVLSGTAFAELTFQTLPEKPASFAEVVDKSNPLKTIVSGAYAVDVAVSETETRPVVVYLAETYQQTQSYIMIVPDSGMTAEQVLVDGGWQKIADDNGLFLMILQGEVTQDYYTAATKLAGTRDYWMQSKGRNYVVGYGDAADLVLQNAEKSVTSWAGAAIFGDVTTAAADLQNAKGIDLPIWLFVSEYDSETELVELFKTYNKTTDEAFSNAFADLIYFPDQQTTRLLLNDQPVSQVRVTIAADAAGLNAGRNAAVYDFFTLATREVGFGDKAMRFAADLEKYGATRETIEIDGITRTWVQYVPARLRETAEGRIPLMLVLHGNALNGEYFVDRTNFMRLADEFGFAIVFPTGSIADAVSPTWNINNAADQWNDTGFIKAMIDTVCADLPIDTSRIYCYGHSMGGMFTQDLVSYLDGTFAAVAGTGCTTDMVAEPTFEHETPIFVIMGEFDNFGTTYNDEAAQYFIKAFTAKNNVSDQPTAAYRMGRYENYVFQNEAGVPMVRFTIADEMPHTATLDEGLLIFEFLSQFSRAEDGSLVYGGGICNAK